MKCTVVLMIIALITPFRARADAGTTIVSVTGQNSSNSISLSSNSLAAVHWSSTAAYSNVNVAAQVFCTPCRPGLDTSTVNVYLTRQIGPGATSASQVAFAQVTIGGARTLVTVLSGLTLTPGDYYLVIYSPYPTVAGGQPPGTAPAAWGGASDANVTIVAAPGTSREDSFIYATNTNTPQVNAGYPPSSNFQRSPTSPIYDLNGDYNLQYQVTSSPPSSIAHIAAGGGWTTVITLVNLSSAPVSVTVALHNDDGNDLMLPVTTTQQDTSQTITVSSVSATMNPNSTLIISMGNQVASTVVGWADVTSTGSVGGYAIFRQTPQNGSPSEGSVSLQSQFSPTVTLPYDNTAGFVMGVALANLSTSFANVTVTMWDDVGNQIGTQNLNIAGSGHSAFVLPNQFPLTSGKRGIVRFQSTGGIAGLGLRFSPFGTFTSVPTM